MSAPTSEPQEADAGRPPVTGWLVMVGVVVGLAGLLFGYDQGVISGALTGITAEFSLSDTLVEVITSWVTLGALAGALAAGLLADRLGRRLTIFLAAGLFVVGAAVEAAAPGPAVLVVGRLVVGLGVGVASVAAPLYAAEMAPAHLRGRFVSLYQLAITVGIFIAYAVDQVLVSSDSWRAMVGVSAIPALLLALAMLPMPDSPRWLLARGRRDAAREGLARVHGSTGADAELAGIEGSLEADRDQASWREVFGRSLRRPLAIGVGLALFQQLTGINAVIYYADEIFRDAGFATPADQAAATTWAIGAVNVLTTFVAVAYVDRFGRKPLLLAGLVGMVVSLTTVGACFVALDRHDAGTAGPTAAGIFTLVALVVFVASFAFSLGPVVWTVISEIFPNRVRGRAVAVATAANWGSAWIVSQFFLTMVDGIGKPATFWSFAAIGVVAFVWVRVKVPETRGRTLEEIERLWPATGSELSSPDAATSRGPRP